VRAVHFKEMPGTSRQRIPGKWKSTMQTLPPNDDCVTFEQALAALPAATRMVVAASGVERSAYKAAEQWILLMGRLMQKAMSGPMPPQPSPRMFAASEQTKTKQLNC
jgi:hypothetical protein